MRDTNEKIWDNGKITLDKTTDDNDNSNLCTVTIIQPTKHNLKIRIYVYDDMRVNTQGEYEYQSEGVYRDYIEEYHDSTFKASNGSEYIVQLLDGTTGKVSRDYSLLNVASRGKITRDITIKLIKE